LKQGRLAQTDPDSRLTLFATFIKDARGTLL
jgi:hypothetical protein